MSATPISSLAVAVALSACSFACGSDQKQPSTAETMSNAEQAPSAPAPDNGDAATPTGAPAESPTSPPSAEAPQSGTDARTGNAVAMSGSGSSAPAATALSQAQVALIAELANTAEVEQGKLAESKAKSPRVKKFASIMVKHHSEAKADQAKIFKELKLTPTQSQEANALKGGADQTLGALKGADGAAFDTTYINAQVDEHQKVLDTIDRQLLPAASDEKLVEGLKKMRATVVAHLDEAKSIQQELQNNGK